MEELITSYLVQEKECGLPLLGSFKIKTKPASYDVADKQIYPPTDEVLFSETEDYLPENLVDYISATQRITRNQAEQTLHKWCLNKKAGLDAGEKITFNSLGSLQKNAGGSIFFQRMHSISFYDTFAAERVIHTNDEHSMLVGDRETTSKAMDIFYRENITSEKKSSWKMWALILFIISLLVLCYYFYDNDFAENTIGNQSSFPVANPPGTYSVPK